MSLLICKYVIPILLYIYSFVANQIDYMVKPVYQIVIHIVQQSFTDTFHPSLMLHISFILIYCNLFYISQYLLGDNVFQLPNKTIDNLVKYYYSWKMARRRTSINYQPCKLGRMLVDRAAGSDNASQLEFNSDLMKGV